MYHVYMRVLSKLRTRLVSQYETMNLITVSRSAILHNFDTLLDIHKLPIIPVLKANAYGHGMAEVATILKNRTFPLIAVDGYYEALAIRQVSKQPVLVMGSIGSNNINKLRAKDVSFVVFSIESFEKLKKTARNLNVHLEINTGMNRHGLSLKDLHFILTKLPNYPNLNVEGVMTHLSSADEAIQDYSEQQFIRFEKALKRINSAGLHPRLIHASNSAATAKNLPDYINAVRPGIALYGINTLAKSDPFYNRLSKLRPALKLISKIDQIIDLGSGEYVGYNRTYKTSGAQKIATIPIGYYEGIPRSLSNKDFVTNGDQLLQTTGTICMNHMMFDCTNTSLKVGESVTLISNNASAPNSIINLRDSYEMFEYSLPVGLQSTVRRRLVG